MFKTVTLEFWLSIGLILIARGTAMMDHQRFAIEPQDQTAIVGSRVTLPCRVINKTGSLQWTKDDFALGTHRSLTEFFRYAMIGSDEEGDFSLAIEPVQLEDDARYQCQVSPGPDGEPGIRSRFARLTVLVPPNKPRIIQGGYLETTEDSEIQLECVSQAGKPPAEITWIDGLGNVITKRTPNVDIRYDVEPTQDKLFTAKSILSFRPKKEHHNTTFVCQAQNAADRTYKSAKILLLVKYAPKVTVSVVPEDQMLIEYTDAKLVCKADANPPVVTYRWFINQQLAFSEGSNPTEFIIKNVTRIQHDSIVKCEARNLVGKSEDSQTLDITYGPRFRRKPESIQADSGTVAHLFCDVDGNPNPEITWYFNNDKMVGKSPNLTIDVNRGTVGRYSCRAFVSPFPEIRAEAYVRMNGRPTIKKDSVRYGLLGESVKLECIAYSIPTPEKTSWSFKGQEINPNHKDYLISEDTMADGLRSTLEIRDSRQEHYGTYNCSMTNQYGTDMTDITLKLQKSFPLSMFVGIGVIAVVSIFAFIMILILCRHNEKKPLPDIETHNIEKQCKESDKSSNISELKLEMRTGSSTSNINCESDYGGGRDSDSIITRVAVPLAGPVSIDQRYFGNRLSTTDFVDTVYQSKVGQNNNGYVPYLDYSRVCTPTSLTVTNGGVSPIVTSSGLTSLDLRYSATYGNPYLKLNHNCMLPSPPSIPGQPPPPPPYSTLKNGSVPHLSMKSSLSNLNLSTSTSSSQFIVANNKPQQVTIKNPPTQATHV